MPAILKYAVQINLLARVLQPDSGAAARRRQRARRPAPGERGRVLDQLRQFGFIVLYALMLTGMLNQLIAPPTIFFYRLLLL